jgi:hypothetical protein
MRRSSSERESWIKVRSTRLVQTVLKQMGYAGGERRQKRSPACTAPVAQGRRTQRGTRRRHAARSRHRRIQVLDRRAGTEQPASAEGTAQSTRRASVPAAAARVRARRRCCASSPTTRAPRIRCSRKSRPTGSRAGLFEVQSQITDKDEYLTRPDKGRLLSQAAIDDRPEAVQEESAGAGRRL